MGNYVVLPEEYVRPMPKSLTFEDAASIPYTLMTAWEMLVTQGGIEPNNKNKKKVLICGGLRPTEMVAVQLAKL